jgi:hypothetical protein
MPPYTYVIWLRIAGCGVLHKLQMYPLPWVPYLGFEILPWKVPRAFGQKYHPAALWVKGVWVRPH